MSQNVEAGPPATLDHLRDAQERDRLLRTELPRVRAAAAAWRNGVAGLLTALAGFSLIKGQSNVDRLDGAWAIGVGIALLTAFLAGTVGAMLLIRAANGRPTMARVGNLITRAAADHEEAYAAASALRLGIALTLSCSALLVIAVGLCWYAPSDSPTLQVSTPTETQCGSQLQIVQGKLIIDTPTGVITLDQSEPSTIRPAASCPSP